MVINFRLIFINFYRNIFLCWHKCLVLFCSKPEFICNVHVERTRPNAVDRLGWTTYRAIFRVDLITNCSDKSFTCGYVGADATSSPPFTLAMAHPRLQPAQGRASTTPTSWRARHCNVHVKRTRPNAVDRLGWSTYRAILDMKCRSGLAKVVNICLAKILQIPSRNFVTLFIRVEVDLKTTLVTSLLPYCSKYYR